MSETVLKIMLSELKMLRIVCKQCKTAVELNVSDLERGQDPNKRKREVHCPGCGTTIRLAGDNDHPPPEDALDRLAAAWKALDAMKGHFEVQFVVVPAKPEIGKYDAPR